ncbi:unnamed protein product [Cuscuta campestris]|uniref:Uncharacterized protein n=1 Tax=Cuscuta campestris TaxID=132261 RepID=A0A484KPK3_9ASTE|nr:unnamed protein product [Cuscuta campestris]
MLQARDRRCIQVLQIKHAKRGNVVFGDNRKGKIIGIGSVGKSKDSSFPRQLFRRRNRPLHLTEKSFSRNSFPLMITRLALLVVSTMGTPQFLFPMMRSVPLQTNSNTLLLEDPEPPSPSLPLGIL